MTDFDIRKTRKADRGLNEEYLHGAEFTLRGPAAQAVFEEVYKPQGFTKVGEAEVAEPSVQVTPPADNKEKK